MDTTSHETLEHLGLDLNSTPSRGSFMSNTSRLSLHSNSEDSGTYELKIRHSTGENVFWDGKFSLQSEVVCKLKPNSLTSSIGFILGKYLPTDYWDVKSEATDTDSVVLIDTHFRPLKLTDMVESLFGLGETTATVLLRSRESYVSEAEAKKSFGKKLYDAGASYANLDGNSVELTVEEVSGRPILWDSKQEAFVPSVQLFFSRSDLPTTRLDSVLTTTVARNYLENNAGILEKQFWTDKIKVVGLKDTLDVLFMNSNRSKLYLKYIRNAEEQQWQEIIDAMNLFKQKISKSDEHIRNYYSENHIFEELDILKAKIQRDDRNEAEIEDLMRRMEPKLVRALDVLKEYEVAEGEESLRRTKSVHRGTSTIVDKPVTQPDKSHAQFYDWW